MWLKRAWVRVVNKLQDYNVIFALELGNDVGNNSVQPREKNVEAIWRLWRLRHTAHRFWNLRLEFVMVFRRKTYDADFLFPVIMISLLYSNLNVCQPDTLALAWTRRWQIYHAYKRRTGCLYAHNMSLLCRYLQTKPRFTSQQGHYARIVWLLVAIPSALIVPQKT